MNEKKLKENKYKSNQENKNMKKKREEKTERNLSKTGRSAYMANPIAPAKA